MKNRLILIFLLIGVMLLCACPALANELALPAGLREIGDEAFMGDRSLDEVNLPDGTVSIGARAFAQTSLKRIYLPTTVKEIAPDAFTFGEFSLALEHIYYYVLRPQEK